MMIKIFKYILLYVAGFITVLHNSVLHHHDEAGTEVEDFVPIEKDNSVLSWLAILLQTDTGEGHLHNIVKENPGSSSSDLDLIKVLPPVPAVASYAPLLLTEHHEQEVLYFRIHYLHSQFIVQTTLLRGPPSLV